MSSREAVRASSLRIPVIPMICFLIIAIACPLFAAPLQETSGKKPESKAVPRVSLSQITGNPGSSLMVPFYYTADPKIPLRSLKVDIEFVSNHLEFQKAAPGVFPKDVIADITANVTKGTPNAKGIVRSTLHLSVALKGKNLRKGLPDGLLAFLLFQVTMDAKPFSIKLEPKVIAAEDLHTPPRKVANIAAVPGKVVVSIPNVMPEATCFFFSH